MRKIKLVQIGVGHDHACSSFVTLMNMSDVFDVVGVVVCGGNEGRYERHIDVYGKVPALTIEEAFAIEDLDAAVVETDDIHLTEYAQMAADRGLHVQMDKPGTPDNKAFEKLARTLKEKGKVFHMGYMYRYNPAVKKLMADIKNGKLGEILSVEAHMSCAHPPQKREWLGQFPGGMNYYLGCHLVDLVTLIQGIPEEIIPLNVRTGLDGVDSEDFGMAVFKYKNGVSFEKSTAVEIGGYVRRQLVVTGTKGTVELKPFEYYAPKHEGWDLPLYTGVAEIYVEDTEGKGWSDQRHIYDTEPYDRYIDMIKAFGDIINGKYENPYGYEYEVRLHKMILSACGVDIDYKEEIRI